MCLCGKEHFQRCLKHSKALMEVKMLMIPVFILFDGKLLLELKLPVTSNKIIFILIFKLIGSSFSNTSKIPTFTEVSKHQFKDQSLAQGVCTRP